MGPVSMCETSPPAFFEARTGKICWGVSSTPLFPCPFLHVALCVQGWQGSPMSMGPGPTGHWWPFASPRWDGLCRQSCIVLLGLASLLAQRFETYLHIHEVSELPQGAFPLGFNC